MRINGPLGGIGAALCAVGLAASMLAVGAQAAEPVVCTPFEDTVCATDVPVRDLDDGVPYEYSGLVLDTTHVTASDLTWESGWRRIEWGNMQSGTQHTPVARDGATLLVSDIGVWHRETGDVRVDARLRFDEVNGIGVGIYQLDDGQTNTGLDIQIEGDRIAAEANGMLFDPSTPRHGARITVSLIDHGTGEPLPADVRGTTGFYDLDGNGHDLSLIGEGWEMIDGVDAVYKHENAHLARFGENGWAGVTDLNGDLGDPNPGEDHAALHYMTATFTGPTFTLRYSAREYRGSGLQPIAAWNDPAYPLVYDLNDGTGVIPNGQEQ